MPKLPTHDRTFWKCCRSRSNKKTNTHFYPNYPKPFLPLPSDMQGLSHYPLSIAKLVPDQRTNTYSKCASTNQEQPCCHVKSWHSRDNSETHVDIKGIFWKPVDRQYVRSTVRSTKRSTAVPYIAKHWQIFDNYCQILTTNVKNSVFFKRACRSFEKCSADKRH